MDVREFVLACVERAASALFTERGLAGVVADDTTSLEELSHAHAAGLLWVARALDGERLHNRARR